MKLGELSVTAFAKYLKDYDKNKDTSQAKYSDNSEEKNSTIIEAIIQTFKEKNNTKVLFYGTVQLLLYIYYFKEKPDESVKTRQTKSLNLICEVLDKVGSDITLEDESATSTSVRPYYSTSSYNYIVNGNKNIKPLVYNDTDTINNIFEKLKKGIPEKASDLDKLWEPFLNIEITNTGSIKMSDEKKYEDYKTDIEDAIKNGAKQIILTGAPGTGKTKMAEDIAKALGSYYELVQFHPSYDYTDFVEGLRPVEIGNKVVFKKIDGTFKKFCRKATKAENKDSNYFFIIDEINRADLSKVFGELMYGLEQDKRDKKFKTQYQNLPTWSIEDKKELSNEEEEDVFFDEFYIPKNVIVIGTMNDIDRSVESIDFALRRRFLWMEIKVTEDLLKSAFKTMENNAFKNVADDLAERVSALNKIIKDDGKKFDLNEHYYISQGLFAGLPRNIISKLPSDNQSSDYNKKLSAFLEEVFKWRIEPTLREYIRGETSEEINTFIGSCKDALIPENKSTSQSDSSAN